jgi:hypothetical protein
MLAYSQLHFIDESSVEQVKWTLVATVVHVIDIRLQCPINSLCSKFVIAILVKQGLCVPRFEDRPLMNRFCENERLVTPTT